MNKPANQLKARCAQALDDMRASGVSLSQWARDNGYSRDVVASVLYGRSACRHGKAHEVAVALGIKSGQVVEPGSFRPRIKAVAAALERRTPTWNGVERRATERRSAGAGK